jgi:hypothetical protein
VIRLRPESQRVSLADCVCLGTTDGDVRLLASPELTAKVEEGAIAGGRREFSIYSRSLGRRRINLNRTGHFGIEPRVDINGWLSLQC